MRSDSTLTLPLLTRDPIAANVCAHLSHLCRLSFSWYNGTRRGHGMPIFRGGRSYATRNNKYTMIRRIG